MRIIYCTSINFPSSLANRIQIINMSAEFQRILGKNFFLGCNNFDKDENKHNINIINFYSKKALFLSLKYLFFCKKNKINYIYCRESRLLFFLIIFNKIFFRLNIKYIYGVHWLGANKVDFYIDKFLINHVNHFVFITNCLKNSFFKAHVKKEKSISFIISPDGVNIDNFSFSANKGSLRKILNLPADKKIILYSGSLKVYDWKGVDIFLNLVKFFNEEYYFILVGGKSDSVEEIRSEYDYKNLSLIGHVNHDKVPLYLKSADVLVLPNKSGNIISECYTSPLKLFEYMASDIPIVASSLPSIREILNEENSFLFEANNISDLSEKISFVLKNKEEAEKRAKKAFEDVKKYTWRKRAENIINFIKNN